MNTRVPTEKLIEQGLAKVISCEFIALDKDRSRCETHIGASENIDGPIEIISFLCEGLGFMLSHLRQSGTLTPEEFRNEVNVCINHIQNALIDYNEKIN